MSFYKTEQLIQKLNENPDAIIPDSGFIASNHFHLNSNKVKLSRSNRNLVVESFKKDYNLSNQKNEYFFGCKFETYRNSYTSELAEYLALAEDAIEPEFILCELGIFKEYFVFPYYDHETFFKIICSLKRREEFLLDRLDELGYEYVSIRFNYLDNETNQQKMYQLKRKCNFKKKVRPKALNISQTQFMELFKSLFDSGYMKGKQNDALLRFSNRLGMKINNPDKLLQDIKNRANGNETLFLDKLKSSLLNFFN